LNRAAVESAVRLGLAVGSHIRPRCRFARKHYFYPDLPKGFQISQYDEPLCEGGVVTFRLNGEVRQIRLTRIHMEDDAGKNIHDASGVSFVDYNRAGVPLCEIVSEPDIRSADEAAEYVRAIRTLVRYLGISDGNMEEGSLRCDANVSIRPRGETKLGTKAELKNINSFKNVRDAIEHEIARQTVLLDRGEKVVQETRLWDPDRGISASMRSKEQAHDYRYFPEPDLPPVVVDEAWLAVPVRPCRNCPRRATPATLAWAFPRRTRRCWCPSGPSATISMRPWPRRRRTRRKSPTGSSTKCSAVWTTRAG
jgi:aspartyl-tRNA(Asn)/glutamyl-tRNA(Gln) amidotransferase subunit B